MNDDPKKLVEYESRQNDKMDELNKSQATFHQMFIALDERETQEVQISINI